MTNEHAISIGRHLRDVLEQFMQEFPDEASVKLEDARKQAAANSASKVDLNGETDEASKGLENAVSAAAAAMTVPALG